MTENKCILRKWVTSHKNDKNIGITSVCSANPVVLETSIRFAAGTGSLMCIEATCNQVNQYGGYTGMRPAEFTRFVHTIAGKARLSAGQLILGGDHMGPFPWQNEPAAAAMDKAKQMVSDYVRAGFTKIHLDASMKLADDDPGRHLEPEIATWRAAELCAAAEQTAEQQGQAGELSYVIGTEVPVPGGMQGSNNAVHVSAVRDTLETIEAHKAAFANAGLEGAWDRVAAVVVQPGVEFGNFQVVRYNRAQAASLSKFVETQPQLVYEAHSTDYQPEQALRQMVEDHFAILKVGPELTFAFREAVFALESIERECSSFTPGMEPSNLRQTVDRVMLENPAYWRAYYPGSDDEQAFARKYSFSDRIRYYWTHPDVQGALDRLFANLAHTEIPLSLLSQYLPWEHTLVREGKLALMPQELVKAHIEVVLARYFNACS